MVIPLQGVGVTRHGEYRLMVSSDVKAKRTLRVWVLDPVELQLPPLS